MVRVAYRRPDGLAVTANGPSLCKLHRAAYEGLLLGVRPDLMVEVDEELLQEGDGPLLVHGLQGVHGQSLRCTPTRDVDRPSESRLEWRYEHFRARR